MPAKKTKVKLFARAGRLKFTDLIDQEAPAKIVFAELKKLIEESDPGITAADIAKRLADADQSEEEESDEEKEERKKEKKEEDELADWIDATVKKYGVPLMFGSLSKTQKSNARLTGQVEGFRNIIRLQNSGITIDFSLRKETNFGTDTTVTISRLVKDPETEKVFMRYFGARTEDPVTPVSSVGRDFYVLFKIFLVLDAASNQRVTKADPDQQLEDALLDHAVIFGEARLPTGDDGKVRKYYKTPKSNNNNNNSGNNNNNSSGNTNPSREHRPTPKRSKRSRTSTPSPVRTEKSDASHFIRRTKEQLDILHKHNACFKCFGIHHQRLCTRKFVPWEERPQVIE